MEARVIRLGNNDILLLQQLIQLFREVFEMGLSEPADETYLRKLLARPGFTVFVVICENEIAGGLTAYELPLYYGDYSDMYIYDMAVKTAFQRKGFGKQLISSLKQYCLEGGIRCAFVEASEQDEHAVEFYRSTGAVEERVVHFDYYLPSAE